MDDTREDVQAPYEPPAVETELNAEEIEREVHYAGAVTKVAE